MFYGDIDKSKKHFTPPPHQKINNPPNFSVKEKETRNYAFFKAVHGSGTKRSRKNVLSV